MGLLGSRQSIFFSKFVELATTKDVKRARG